MNAQLNNAVKTGLGLTAQADMLKKYESELSVLASQLNKKDADSAIASDAGAKSKSTVTAALKTYAEHTAADGIDVEVARGILRVALTINGVKEGTIKASGNHYAGFRAMLGRGVKGSEWNEATVADAQSEIASDESKAKATAKKEWSTHTAKWSAADWNKFLIEQGVRQLPAEGTSEGVSEGEQADLSAALAQAQPAEGQPEQRTGTGG